MTKKILDLIPDALRDDLIEEVKELLKSTGSEIIDPKDKQKNDQTDASIQSDIEDWANRGKVKK